MHNVRVTAHAAHMVALVARLQVAEHEEVFAVFSQCTIAR